MLVLRISRVDPHRPDRTRLVFASTDPVLIRAVIELVRRLLGAESREPVPTFDD